MDFAELMKAYAKARNEYGRASRLDAEDEYADKCRKATQEAWNSAYAAHDDFVQMLMEWCSKFDSG